MSARDLASLRALTRSPPLSGADDPGQSADLASAFHVTPRTAAFAIDKGHGVNFREISREKGESYRRVIVEHDEPSSEEQHATRRLRQAIGLRESWVYFAQKPEWVRGPFLPEEDEADPKEPTPAPAFDPFDPDLPDASDHTIEWRNGLVCVSGMAESAPQGLSYSDFAHDLELLLGIVNDPEVRTYAWRRLKLITEKTNMYGVLNGDDEMIAQKKFPHRDFYNTIKVDTHVHHSSCANQKHFLTFIKSKLKKHGGDVVLANRDDPNGPPLTLREVFESINLKAQELSIDTLDVHANSGYDLFQRFDRFNLKYNPLGQSRLREVFLKTDNIMGGRYLGELTKEVLSDQAFLKYQLAEYRISVYGKSREEWSRLGTWFHENRIFGKGTRWLVQVPRLYSSYAERGLVSSFGEFLRNIFEPMFEATINPKGNPRIYALLQQMVGVDSVDDESLPPPKVSLKHCDAPDQWTSKENPPYSYYSYHIQANLATLNRLREERGLNTLAYRPHSGEAGPVEHLAASYLLANGINHGLNLKESPVLQYLYYLCQIGIAMSPIGNSALFVEYAKNPAYEFFVRGLNVSLSTDDPLQFAMTREPLMEEYSVFAVVNRLSNTDLAELARNSVLQSGFEACIKKRWLGPRWYLSGAAGNDPAKSNVPNMRLRYRYDTLVDEIKLLWRPNESDQDSHYTRIRTLPTWWGRNEDTPPIN